MRNGLLVVVAVAGLVVTRSVMPAAASTVTFTCTANLGTRSYSGTLTVDSSTLIRLQVGQVIELRNGTTATIVSVNTIPNSLSGSARLSTGQIASVACSF